MKPDLKMAVRVPAGKQRADVVSLRGTTPITGPIRLTQWTASSPVTKTLRLRDDGTLEKSSTASQLYEGRVSVLETNVKQFAGFLPQIGPKSCLSYGIPIDDEATRVMTRARFDQARHPQGAMARTTDAMCWPKAEAILMIDYDPGIEKCGRDELLRRLRQVCPALHNAACIWTTSASSCVRNSKTKQEVTGIAGQRVYVVVANGEDIPRAGEVLAKRLWLAGYGEIRISKAGSLLIRGPVDTAVFQSNRIDYCAPAICEPPLQQRKPAPIVYGDPSRALDTEVALPDLSPAEEREYQSLVERAKAEKAGEARAVRAQYQQQRVKDLVARGCDEATAEKIVSDALERSVLSADFELTAQDGTVVTVGELLDDRARWHGQRFADPVEPDYHGDTRIACAYLNGPGRPRIYSFAHGGRSYELTRAAKTIRLEKGSRAMYMGEIVATLQEQGEHFCRANELVTIDALGYPCPQNEQHVLTTLDHTFRFETSSKQERVAADAPLGLARNIVAARSKSFPPLRAVAMGPALVPATGRLITAPGYDAETQTFITIPDGTPAIPERPTLEQVWDAVRTLWWAFRRFPFVDAIDESVMLAELLTAAVRPFLKTAPAFGHDAPTQASGKTLLVKCVSELRGGLPHVCPPPDAKGDDEMRKRLFAALVCGYECIVIDNLVGEFDSPALAALLTTDTYGDRVLGLSRMRTVPATAMVLLTGNNLTLKGDLPRRVLRCRIDPQVEAPHQRMFDFDPAEVVRTHRQPLVVAALTILRAYCLDREQGGQRLGAGRLASFEEWDDLVRQAICWLAQQPRKMCDNGSDMYPRLVDPMIAVNEAVTADPTRTLEARLLHAWAAEIGTGPGRAHTLMVKELVQRAAWRPHEASNGDEADDDRPEPLHDVLVEIAGNPGTGMINAHRLGKALSKFADRVTNGKRLRKGPDRQNTSTWWVEDLGGDGGCGGFVSSPDKKGKNNSVKSPERTSPTKSTKPPRPRKPSGGRSVGGASGSKGALVQPSSASQNGPTPATTRMKRAALNR